MSIKMMNNTITKLMKITGKTEEEATALIALALDHPSKQLIDAIIERIVYLKIAEPEEIERYKKELEKLFEVGTKHHFNKQARKLNRF